MYRSAMIPVVMVAQVVLISPKDMFQNVCHLIAQGSMKLKGRFIVYADDFAAVAAAYGVTKPFYAGW